MKLTAWNFLKSLYLLKI